jgi:hypothetical protein
MNFDASEPVKTDHADRSIFAGIENIHVLDNENIVQTKHTVI